jgi:CheY-like chemotaxis protein
VLVVDDDTDSRDLLSRALSDRGASVQSASSTRQALEMASQTPPRVLVSDIGIPGEDGCKLIRQLRARGRTAADLHAIAVTAMARAEDRERGLEAGYDAYLVKPVDLDALVDMLASLACPPVR